MSSQNIRLATQQLHRLSLNRNRTPCTCIDAITLALVISNYRYLMIINGDHVENDVHLQQGKEQLLLCERWYPALKNVVNVIIGNDDYSNNSNPNNHNCKYGNHYDQHIKTAVKGNEEASAPLAIILRSLNNELCIKNII